MDVKRGWNTEYGKRKFDVAVEEADLLRMLAERGALDPAQVAAGMLTQDVYLIMDAEAMAFVHHSLSRQEPEQAEKHLAKLKEHRGERDALLDKYVPRKPAE